MGYLRDRVQFVGYGEGEALHYVGLEGYAEVVSLVVVEGRE